MDGQPHAVAQPMAEGLAVTAGGAWPTVAALFYGDPREAMLSHCRDHRRVLG